MSRGGFWTKVVENNPGKYPERAGFTWDEEESMNLLLAIRQNQTFETIAENHQRTKGSIICQLKRIAVDYNNEGMELKKIMKYTRLFEEQINEAIEKDRYKKIPIEEKNKLKEEKNKNEENNITNVTDKKEKRERRKLNIVDNKDEEILETLKNIEDLLKKVLEKL